MKTFKQFLQEKLSLDVAKQFSRDWNREYYDKWFGKNVYRLYFDENSGNQFEDSSPHKKIESILKKNGYEIENWEAGLAKKKGKDKNLFKIGKLLNRFDPELKKEYDLLKDSSSKLLDDTDDKKKLVVISRHPYDIAGMSSDREWDSCMKIDPKTGAREGTYSHHVKNYIKNNALIAYLIYADDKNIQKPLGRILIYPYFSDIGLLYLTMSDSAYGKITANTRKVVQDFLDTHQKVNQKNLMFRKVQVPCYMYTDQNPKEFIVTPQDSTYEIILKRLMDCKESGGRVQPFDNIELRNIDNWIEYTKKVSKDKNLLFWISSSLENRIGVISLDQSLKVLSLDFEEWNGEFIPEYIVQQFSKINLKGTYKNIEINGTKKTDVNLEDVTISGDSRLIRVVFINGYFYGSRKSVIKFSVWKNGIFKSPGTVLGCNWLDGKFMEGIFKVSKWTTGQFKSGIFESSVWNDGTFFYGDFIDQSTWHGGVFYGGSFRNSQWLGGSWKQGIWYSGTDKNGILHKNSPDNWDKK